jgi:putative oxidoreductase
MDRHAMIAAMELLGKVLLSLIFVLNALGIIDQAGAAREMLDAGVPSELVPAALWSGRVVQLAGGMLLVCGSVALAAVGCLLLAGFLVPATFIGHRFWAAAEEARRPQLVNFLKNAAIIGGLLCLAVIYGHEAGRIP